MIAQLSCLSIVLTLHPTTPSPTNVMGQMLIVLLKARSLMQDTYLWVRRIEVLVQ